MDSFMDVSALSKVDKHGRPMIITVEEDSGQEDQDGDLKSDVDKGSLGIKDTQGISKFGNGGGQAIFDTDKKCHMCLSAKAKSHTMLCGHDHATSACHKHQELQTKLEKRGDIGYCIATSGSKELYLMPLRIPTPLRPR
jgi:hypothetical protein